MRLLAAAALLLTAACGTPPPPGGPAIATRDEVTALASEIRSLGANVDPAEAERAAEISFSYARQLAFEYQVTDPPLVHNAKVNMGLRPRGLCWHWAEDMEARLKAENFRTLELHRAIANSESTIRIDHSTAIISSRGDDMYAGVILDPWRYGGTLHWSKTLEDDSYVWRPQQEVLAEKYPDHPAVLAFAGP